MDVRLQSRKARLSDVPLGCKRYIHQRRVRELNTVIATNRAWTDQSLGVFKGNRLLPIHRWYSFVEGYSANLVDLILQEHRTKGKVVVFDPFAGSGTTPLAARFFRLDSLVAQV